MKELYEKFEACQERTEEPNDDTEAMKNLTGLAKNTIQAGWPSMAENHWYLEYVADAATE